jgi:hypothetical protein
MSVTVMISVIDSSCIQLILSLLPIQIAQLYQHKTKKSATKNQDKVDYFFCRSLCGSWNNSGVLLYGEDKN